MKLATSSPSSGYPNPALMRAMMGYLFTGYPNPAGMMPGRTLVSPFPPPTSTNQPPVPAPAAAPTPAAK